MDLQPYFEAQKKLDEHIIKEKGLQGQDLLDKKILALQVELGELANEWRGFKFWSNDQKPRMTSCNRCDEDGMLWGKDPNMEFLEPLFECDCDDPLLEEYVDCLHFILSIGLGLDYQDLNRYQMNPSNDLVTEFNLLYANVSSMWLSSTTESWIKHHLRNDYRKVFSMFLYLGEMLGFSEQQIHDAYFDKNATNHRRQETGY